MLYVKKSNLRIIVEEYLIRNKCKFDKFEILDIVDFKSKIKINYYYTIGEYVMNFGSCEILIEDITKSLRNIKLNLLLV